MDRVIIRDIKGGITGNEPFRLDFLFLSFYGYPSLLGDEVRSEVFLSGLTCTPVESEPLVPHEGDVD